MLLFATELQYRTGSLFIVRSGIVSHTYTHTHTHTHTRNYS